MAAKRQKVGIKDRVPDGLATFECYKSFDESFGSKHRLGKTVFRHFKILFELFVSRELAHQFNDRF